MEKECQKDSLPLGWIKKVLWVNQISFFLCFGADRLLNRTGQKTPNFRILRSASPVK
jgi:hypothetical protein